MDAPAERSRDSDLSRLIGARVREARSARGWTLDELADRAQVSRRTVVNIEQGVANASISVLLRLTSALGSDLASIVAFADSETMVVQPSENQSVVWRGDHGGAATLVRSLPGPDVIELWHWTLGPGDIHKSDRHTTGTREIVHVVTGCVRITAGNDIAVLDKGDSVSFDGDQTHSYANVHETTSAFTLVVHQPGVTS